MYSAWPSPTEINPCFDEYRFLKKNNDLIELSDFNINSTFSKILADEFPNLPFLVEETDIHVPHDGVSIPLQGFGVINMSNNEHENSFPSIVTINGEDSWSNNSEHESGHISLINETEKERQLSIFHLLRAYVEAMDRKQSRLGEIIVKRISENISIIGAANERLLFYLFKPLDKQACYLKQESAKNFPLAFKAFYQIFPYGKFAHFAANQAILEAMPRDVAVVHIIDFDMGEGIQWPSLIESLGWMQKEIKLTSINWRDGNFDDTRKLLCSHAQLFGVKLSVESMDLDDLMRSMKNVRKRSWRREWLVFNCMVGLPHMRRVRTRRDVVKFMRVAKDLLDYTRITSYNDGGVVTFGDGDAFVESKCSYGQFIDVHLTHYQALLESIEWTFLPQLGEARAALEGIFVAPLISSLSWMRKWEEFDCCGLQLEDLVVSKQSLMEAKEMVREGESLYEVRVEGKSNNVMILHWSGTPLVRVSCWMG